jgi:hypothetical protein
MYFSLLVPLDRSAFAEQALPLALSIARRANARLDSKAFQTRKAGIAPGASTSVDALISRQRSASAARAASAWPAT